MDSNPRPKVDKMVIATSMKDQNIEQYKLENRYAFFIALKRFNCRFYGNVGLAHCCVRLKPRNFNFYLNLLTTRIELLWQKQQHIR